MGADMVGYLVKGPVKLPKGIKKSLIKYLTNLRDKLINNKPCVCPDCGYSITDGVCDGCRSKQIITKDSSDKEIKQFADEMVNNWPPNFRDCNIRLDPDDENQVIVFAGDMSWGDSPEGTGYLYLQNLFKSGASDTLGIR